MKNGMFSKVLDKMVANFVPQEDSEARLTMQGVVVVKTNTPNGKEWVDDKGTIYPEEWLSDFPVYTIAKSIDQVKVGDIVKVTKSTFATVISTAKGKVETITFGGEHRQAKQFKDLFLGQATVRVVVNLLAGTDLGAGNSMMMLALLDKDGEDRGDAMSTMMLMSMLSGANQNPMGDFCKNPLALSLLMKGDSSRIQDIMMMQAMQNGGFASMFGAPSAPTAPTAPVAHEDLGADPVVE